MVFVPIRLAKISLSVVVLIKIVIVLLRPIFKRILAIIIPIVLNSQTRDKFWIRIPVRNVTSVRKLIGASIIEVNLALWFYAKGCASSWRRKRIKVNIV